MLFRVTDANLKGTSHSAVGQMGSSIDWQPCLNRRQTGMQPVEHLLVATDLRHRSDGAMQRAVQLAVELGAQLNVLHVIETGLPRRVSQRRMAEARTVIHEHLQHLSASTDLDATVNVRMGETVLEIVREAHELGSSAIIIGSERMACHDGNVFANNTQARIIEYSQLPVLLSSGGPDGAYRSAITSVDISPTSVVALQAASRFAPFAQHQAVHIYPDEEAVFQLALGIGEPRASRFQRVQRFVDSVMGSVRSGTDKPEPVVVTIARGAESDVLRRSIRLAQADLLIIGTGREFMSRESSPLLNERHLNGGSCDVLVVPAPIGWVAE
jgi:nucleotide-binding universal stress UspA family protein